MISKDKFLSKTKHAASGCLEWTGGKGGSRGAYGRVCEGRRKFTGYAHRVSWALHFGPIPAGLSVLHRCDNPVCVEPTHLFLGTQADNMHDMAAKKRCGAPKGERQIHAKLTELDVLRIRNSNAPLKDLAEVYDVSKMSVWTARTGRTWKHLPLCP